MKTVCLKDNLKEAILVAERFTTKNINLPVLSNIFIKTADSELILSSTNLEIGSETVSPCKVIKSGSLTVSAKTFSSIVQSLDKEKIYLEERGSFLEVKTEDSSTKINATSPQDFPIIPHIKKPSASLDVNYFDFISALNLVLPTVSYSDIKPEISGVFLYTSGSKLVLVGTDTFRLAERKIDIPKIETGMSFIIPRPTAQELARLNIKDANNIKINYGDEQVEFNFGKVFIISRLVDGKFPEYGGIVPKSSETTLELPREEFIKKIKISSIFSSKLNDVALQLKGDELRITTTNPEVGEHTSLMHLASKHKETVVAFNYRYLLDGLESTSGDSIWLKINGDINPTLIQGSEDKNFLYIVMPIKSSK